MKILNSIILLIIHEKYIQVTPNKPTFGNILIVKVLLIKYHLILTRNKHHYYTDYMFVL